MSISSKQNADRQFYTCYKLLVLTVGHIVIPDPSVNPVLQPLLVILHCICKCFVKKFVCKIKYKLLIDQQHNFTFAMIQASYSKYTAPLRGN